MDKEDQNSNIAVVNFAFDNPQVISKMKDRGAAIQCESWDAVKKIESKLTKKLQTNQKFLDQCQRPVSCFITMMYEFGKD